MTSNADLRRRLREVDISVSELKSRLQSSEYTRRSILHQLQMVGYPVLTIPREITSKIFLHCLVPYSHISDPRRAPILLLHICTAWRSIALSSPGLWAQLYVNFGHPRRLYEAGNFEQLLEVYLARANACPLSLNLIGRSALIPALFNRLSSRIETLRLTINANHYPEHTAGFPQLRKLTICLGLGREDDSGLQGNPIQIFRAASQIRDVLFYRGAVPSLFAIPWNNVTVFTGEEHSSRECVDLLRLAPSLVQCTFIEPYLVPDTPTISHSGLKSFTTNSDILLEFLKLSALQTLELQELGIDDTHIENEHLHSFISHSSKSLHNFSMAIVPPPLSCLSDMVSLTDLELYNPGSEYLTDFFGLLNRAKHRNFLPHLEILTLEECSPYVNAILLEALSSRCTVPQAGEARFRFFRQIWSPQTATDALEGFYQQGFGAALEELVENGLKVYIGHRNAKKQGAWLFNQLPWD
ncbi:hypothetical protein B0H19DRAFT_1146825 [Mycena capillaripes]|nr:hypothetical protein B0H19DRAFT_1146825 [Mycena capillaripes]